MSRQDLNAVTPEFTESLLMLQSPHISTRAHQPGAALDMEVDIHKANLGNSGRVNRRGNKHFGLSKGRFSIFEKKCIHHV